jgi:rubredoxin
MTKYQWTKKQIEEATKDHPPDTPKYMDAFLAAVKEAGQSLTRTKFFELFEACSPSDDDDVDYFDYDILSDRWVLVADFSEAWAIPEAEPLPHITTTARCGAFSLPDDFCSLGGTPEWIQNEKYPICPECDADMVLFLQLKSLPYEITRQAEALCAYTFGDAGNFYLFHCPRCGTHKTSWECY